MLFGMEIHDYLKTLMSAIAWTIVTNVAPRSWDAKIAVVMRFYRQGYTSVCRQEMPTAADSCTRQSAQVDSCDNTLYGATEAASLSHVATRQAHLVTQDEDHPRGSEGREGPQ
jgi:hypothetical protein